MITTTYAAILALFLVMLSLRVIALRGNPLFRFLAFRNLGQATLDRAIRGHGNLAEYAPVMLILMFLGEQQGLSATTLHLLGGMFLVGRLAHGICFGFMTHSMPLRIGGTALTLTAIGALAIRLLAG